MDIVCFISGSGTNYREIVNRDRRHNYLVFTNRPGCAGIAIARENGHPVIELSHTPFLKKARENYGAGKIPRNCPERLAFEQAVTQAIEEQLGKQPDLICLAGYDQWSTDWFVERYYPRILNVHPGDTTKGYAGLHWVPAARAILAGEKYLRSTLFLVDKSMDDGPVLVQSVPVEIDGALTVLEARGNPGLHARLEQVLKVAQQEGLRDLAQFQVKADVQLCKDLELISSGLQEIVKTAGDWKIYPFAVHDLIGAGRVGVAGRKVYLDEHPLPPYGLRMETV